MRQRDTQEQHLAMEQKVQANYTMVLRTLLSGFHYPKFYSGHIGVEFDRNELQPVHLLPRGPTEPGNL